MNKYQRKRSKKIKRIMNADRWGRISYKQARKMAKRGVMIYTINGEPYWTYSYSAICRPMSQLAMSAL